MLFATTVFLAFASSSTFAAPTTSSAVKCQQVSLHGDAGRQLRMVTSSANSTPNQTAGQPGDTFWLDDFIYLSVNPDPAAQSELFGFESCTSSFLGWKTTTTSAGTQYFGHLGKADISGTGITNCLSLYTSIQTEQMVIERECYTADDSTQLDQLWTLIVPPDPNAAIIARFLGQPKSSFNPNQFWDLHPAEKLGQECATCE